MSNRVCIHGHLGKKPELRETAAGKKVTNLNVASTEREKTTWVEVAVWDKLAEICVEHLDKGSEVLVFGSLIQSTYEKEGNKIYTLRVSANTVKFCGKKEKKNNSKAEPQYAQDDIPF